MRLLALTILYLILAATAQAGNNTIIAEDVTTLFTNQVLSASTKVTSSSAVTVNRGDSVALEVIINPPLTGGESLILEPLYILHVSGNSAGYAIPLIPTDSQTPTSGSAFMAIVYPPEGVHSMYLAVTASATSNVTIRARPR